MTGQCWGRWGLRRLQQGLCRSPGSRSPQGATGAWTSTTLHALPHEQAQNAPLPCPFSICLLGTSLPLYQSPGQLHLCGQFQMSKPSRSSIEVYYKWMPCQVLSTCLACKMAGYSVWTSWFLSSLHRVWHLALTDVLTYRRMFCGVNFWFCTMIYSCVVHLELNIALLIT